MRLHDFYPHLDMQHIFGQFRVIDLAKLVKNELANLWQNTSSKRQDLTLMSPVKLFWDNREFLPHTFVVTEASKNYQKKYCV